MHVTTTLVVTHGLEQWAGVVVGEDGQVLHTVVRWSARAARLEAERWATRQAAQA